MSRRRKRGKTGFNSLIRPREVRLLPSNATTRSSSLNWIRENDEFRPIKASLTLRMLTKPIPGAGNGRGRDGWYPEISESTGDDLPPRYTFCRMDCLEITPSERLPMAG